MTWPGGTSASSADVASGQVAICRPRSCGFRAQPAAANKGKTPTTRVNATCNIILNTRASLASCTCHRWLVLKSAHGLRFVLDRDQLNLEDECCIRAENS